MSDSSSYWDIECPIGDPDLFVCMACLEEVFRAKVPIQGCPGCGAVSTFEAFTLDSLQAWGTDELIQKARATGAQPQSTTPPADSPSDADGSHTP